MKKLFFVLSLVLFISCSDNSEKITRLQNQIDSIKLGINNTYQSGLGEFMINIQIHHAKLWFAGINKNWELADFEIQETEELLEDIQKYQSHREEIKTLPIIFAPLDSVKSSIKSKNLVKFKQSYTLLTETCNACHEAANNGFNKIKIPDSPPFSNQIFKPE